MKAYICIHGHFYQPPRENPWLGEIEVQDSAYPFHDWNERITAECYAPNSAARILDAEKNITDIVNNYARMSFNFGPTLLSWLQRNEQELYSIILKADQESRKTFSGHGSAMAQAYNHMIMPLANSKDKQTQVLWGIEDFVCRFQRQPEGMWLPETAVDLETMEIMAQQGIRFTILSPDQASRYRKMGSSDWSDVGAGGVIDPKRPYSVHLPSGSRIAVFFYDGSVSHDIAFGDLLKNGEFFAQRLLQSLIRDQEVAQLVHIATDGESYGHHHRFGDMALAYCLEKIESSGIARLTNYAEYLEKFPPEYEVEIIPDSSWSCVHGVERWRSDCGCSSGRNPSWTQAWRVPLRDAMDWLRDQLSPLYAKEMESYIKDPWATRDDYIQVILDRSEENLKSFFAQHAARKFNHVDKTTVLKLLEMQRNAMLMYTSCGWFFDEISGIESVQVMKYAGRAIQLAKEITGKDLESGYIKRIEKAASNNSVFANAGEVYLKHIKPAVLDLLRIGVHYAVSSLFEDYPETVRIGDYTAQKQDNTILESGARKLALGRAIVRSDLTCEEESISYAVLHLGDQNLNGGARQFSDDKIFSLMESEIKKAFQAGDVPQVVRLMDTHFGDHNYSLWHLLRDKKREVLNNILESTLEEAEASLRNVFEEHYSVMYALKENNIPLPKAFAASMEFILNADFKKLLDLEELDLDDLNHIIDEFRKWELEPDGNLLGFAASTKIDDLMTNIRTDPENLVLLEKLGGLLATLKTFPLDFNLWKSQNMYFSHCQQFGKDMKVKGKAGDSRANTWITLMKSLGEHLSVKCL
jgi:alpha-amylase/alpha-mannosidase (GH57 family)